MNGQPVHTLPHAIQLQNKSADEFMIGGCIGESPFYLLFWILDTAALLQRCLHDGMTELYSLLPSKLFWLDHSAASKLVFSMRKKIHSQTCDY